MNLEYQRRIAARIFKVGLQRVWIDPEKASEVSEALTAEDIRNLVKSGAIKILPKKGNSRGRFRKILKQRLKGRRKGHGSRSGKAGARQDTKQSWVKRIRAQRRYLREVKSRLREGAYRDLYRKASGGFFRSVSHIKLYIEKNNLMRGSE